MTDLWQHLNERKLVQWAVAYSAAAFALLQGVDMVGENFGWPDSVGRILIIASCVGFFITLVLAWFHGERGEQKTSGTEVFLLALLLAIGAGLIWEFSGTSDSAPVVENAESKSQPPLGTLNPAPVLDIPAKSIAVLPFENLSADKDNEFFAIGMQDMILTRLAEIRDLKVISRTSTLEYGSRPTNLKLIARQLGVATVLEGSVQRAGNEVLINVQLIDARTDAHLWAANYQRTLDNIFEVEAEVAKKVAEALHASLTEAETAAVARASTSSPQAYELYLKARYEADQFYNGNKDPAHILLAESYLRQAIIKDPEFALAHAELAREINSIMANGIKDSPERRAEARKHISSALELQPDLAEAHLALAGQLAVQDKDITQAIVEFQTARSLAPNDAKAPGTLALLLMVNGRWVEAQAAMADAIKLDPRSINSRQWAITIAEGLGDYQAAQHLIDQLILKFPEQSIGPQKAAELFLLKGDPAAARLALLELPDAEKSEILARSYYFSRDYQAMLEAAVKAPPAASDGDAGLRELDLGIAARFLEDDFAAKTALEAATNAVKRAMTALPNDVILPYRLAAVRMWQGDQAASMQALEHARQLAAKDWGRAYSELIVELQMAEILGYFGEAVAAVAQLRQLFATPGIGSLYSPAMLRLDPIWDPIRDTPQFEALLNDFPADLVPGQSLSN